MAVYSIVQDSIEAKLQSRVHAAEAELTNFRASGRDMSFFQMPDFTRKQQRQWDSELRTAAAMLGPKGFVPKSMLDELPLLNKAGRVASSVSSNTRSSILGQDKVCRWCRKRRASTLDHVIPKSRGGSNRATNLVGSCAVCNHVKGSFIPKEIGWKLHLPLRAFATLPGNSELYIGSELA